MEIAGIDVSPVVRPQGEWQGVHMFCTTRAGGVGVGPYDSLNLGLGAGDDPKTVLENRQILRKRLPAEPAWLKQVHGVRVLDADALGLVAAQSVPPEADASVTNCPGRVLAVLTADCLSVVIADKNATVLGVAHAGWKGLASGVLEATLLSMKHKEPLAHQWQAWVGPGIGAASFQVGADVRDAFAAELAQETTLCTPDAVFSDKWRLDLAGLARLRLQRMGVEHVEMSGYCTFTALTPPHDRSQTQARQAAMPTFFSYRRDRQTGRMATLAWLETRQ